MFLRPGIEFKPIERDTLRTDWDVGEPRSYFSVEPVFVHPQIPRRITQPDESWDKGEGREMWTAVMPSGFCEAHC